MTNAHGSALLRTLVCGSTRHYAETWGSVDPQEMLATSSQVAYVISSSFKVKLAELWSFENCRYCREKVTYGYRQNGTRSGLCDPKGISNSNFKKYQGGFPESPRARKSGLRDFTRSEVRDLTVIQGSKYVESPPRVLRSSENMPT